MEQYYLEANYIDKQYKKIYIFGAGADAKKLFSMLNHTEIVAFLDNYRGGNGWKIDGIDILSFDSSNKSMYEVPIVIASQRYAGEISSQLCKEGFVPAKDFYIWDEECVYHSNDVIQKYILFNKRVWGKYRIYNKKKKILIPIYHKHNIASIMNAFFSNYFSGKYNAEIVAFFRGTTFHDKISDTMKNIWISCNTSSFIVPKLMDGQIEEAKSLTEQIWERLETWEDWKRINVYGIEFGTTIIRSILKSKIPTFEPRTEHMKTLLFDEIKIIVFWKYYFDDNDVCVVLLDDGISVEGYVREFAVANDIPAYAVDIDMVRKLEHDYYNGNYYACYKAFWNQLTPEEKKIGIEFSKKRLKKRFDGDVSDIPYMNGVTPYIHKSSDEKVIDRRDGVNILICPHIFGEDSCSCGEQLFDNNYMSWFQHIGELSNRYIEYDWYIKPHPNGEVCDDIILSEFVRRYHRIKMLSADRSPIELKKQGIRFALTVHGTIGHEYPLLGITVINAGNNPHMCFGFDYNPRSKKEFDRIIDSLESLENKKEIEEIYQFYCIEHLYYDKKKMDYRSSFFSDSRLTEDVSLMWKKNTLYTYNNYRYYYENSTQETVDNIMKAMKDIVKEVNCWSPSCFYRKL